MDNLIQNLWDSFFGCEISSDREKDASTTQQIAPQKRTEKKSYAEELDTLTTAKGDFMELTISLQEMLSLIPRHRKRIDAYRGFLSYAESQGKKIIITSNKTKNSRL